MQTRQGNFRVIRPDAVVLAKNSPFSRTPPRPVEQRQADYKEKFDARTLFYDVFRVDSRIAFVGPPLLNLAAVLTASDFHVGEYSVPVPHFADLDRTQNSWLNTAPESRTLSVSLPDGVKRTVEVGSDLSDLFANRHVLLTKSKDNDLEWIRDWAAYYVAEHGVDAVLLYDNNSTTYDPEEVLDVLQAVSGLEVAMVVDWAFPFGPQGGNWEGLANAPWDSDFCEYGILQHARLRFLRSAAGVINTDIDELLVAEGGTVFDVLDSSAPVIRYRGSWIEAVPVSGAVHSPPRFSDYGYVSDERQPTTPKWSIDPRRAVDAVQWKTHSVAGVQVSETQRVGQRHFMGITSNWKWDRGSTVAYNSSVHRVDAKLVQAMSRSFGSAEGVPPVLPDDATSSSVRSANNADERRLVLVHAQIAELLDSVPARTWFYRDDVLVVDFVLPAGKFGFDIVELPGFTQLKVVGRDANSAKQLARVLSAAGRSPLANGKHWSLVKLTDELPDQRITGAIATEINEIIRSLTD